MPTEKKERERRQVAALLRDEAYLIVQSAALDPPDVCVRRDGKTILVVEVTAYHSGNAQVRASDKWNNRLWPKIDDLRRQEAILKGIMGSVAFKDINALRLNQEQYSTLATEIVELARSISPNLDDHERVKATFAETADTAPVSIIDPRWLQVSAKLLPLAAKSLLSVTYSKHPVDWQPWSCPQIDAGWSKVSAEKFRSILEEKSAKVWKNSGDPSRYPPGASSWLLIICDEVNDMSAHVFPSDSVARTALLQTIANCGFDFEKSPFNEIWLFSEFRQSKLRLFPAMIAERGSSSIPLETRDDTELLGGGGQEPLF
ncbi:hypothetical protein [Aquisphaera giovannonii]|nr:hypothetical protein [Aquisphaera giovannonii]